MTLGDISEDKTLQGGRRGMHRQETALSDKHVLSRTLKRSKIISCRHTLTPISYPRPPQKEGAE